MLTSLIMVNYIFDNGCTVLPSMTQEPGNMQTNPDTSRPDSTGLNWAARWIDLKVNHLRSVNITHEGDFWMDPDNVRRYLEQTRGEYGRQVAEQLRTMDIRSDDRVLDIGAGSGALAVPLAKRGSAGSR